MLVQLAQQAPLDASDTAQSLRLLDVPEAWIVVLVILPLLAGLAWLGYAREDLSTRAKLILSGLRLFAFCVLAFVLMRPVLVERREEIFSPEVLLLVDDSASMRRQEAYSGDASAREGLLELGFADPASNSRLELALGALDAKLLPRLAERGYNVQSFSFAEDLLSTPEGTRLDGRGQVTHLGDALAKALAGARGRFATDVVIVTDGRSNGGLDPLDAARAAASAGLPVHTIVVGDTRPEKNAVLELVEAPETALEGDELSFAARALGRGDAASERVEVLLEELEPGDDWDDEGRLLDNVELSLDPSGERVVLIAPPGRGDARTSERRFKLRLPPLPDETLVDDNEIRIAVRVSSQKVRVLYIEGYPRWEYRRLALDLLKRAESDIDFQAWLDSATLGFTQERSPGMPALESLPTTRRELLERYDVIILGDANPLALFDDPADGEAFVAALEGFVAGGGGLLFQSGEQDNPRSLVRTPLEQVLPITLDPSAEFGFEGDGRVAFRATLESPLDPHPIVRLLKDPEENRRLWEEPGGLPGFFWYSAVTRVKPGAEVLLRHPTDENRYGRRPLLVAGYYPSGRTLFVGFDSTWRWQKAFGPVHFERFWKGAIRWLALGRLRGEDRRYRLETARATVDISERVVLEARVLDEDYRPSEEASVDVFWAGTDGRDNELTLEQVPGRTGVYTGTLEVDQPGRYEAWIEAEGKRVASTDFEVVLPSREMAEPAPDPETLAAISTITGGTSVELSRIDDLLDEFPGGEEHREPISSRLQDIWDSWWTLAVALLALSLEWILRKRWELV